MLERRTATDVHTPGVRTSEFWLSLLAMLLPVVLPLLQQYGDKAPAGSWVALVVPAVVAVGYNISRGLAKQKVPPPLQQQMIENTAAKVATDELKEAVAATNETALNIKTAALAAIPSNGKEFVESLDDEALEALVKRLTTMAGLRRRRDTEQLVDSTAQG